MKVHIKSTRSGIDAIGEYSINDGTLRVLKGSKVSEDIAQSATFRGGSAIEKHRSGTVENGVVVKDVQFNSPSTAANFVTGRSTNGLIAWRDKDGKTIKSLREEQ